MRGVNMKGTVFYLADVPEENKFHLQNGKVLRNMKELSQEFSEMDDDTFSHHVNDERNDFYNWVKGTIGDNVLANGILPLKDKETMQKKVVTRVNALEATYKRPVKKTKAKRPKKK
ncbi:MAG: hypothetical protein ABIJ21_00305 [Nanoarchaeota archaeon]